MTTVLGLLGLALFIASVIGLAAGVTYGVIRLFPLTNSKDKPAKPVKPAADS